MDAKDARFAAAQRRRQSAIVQTSAVVPFTNVQVIRDEPVTTKLHLTAKETTACLELVAQGRTLLEALRGIQQMRALIASFPVMGGAQ